MPEGTATRALAAMTRFIRSTRTVAAAADDVTRKIRAYRRVLQTEYSRTRCKALKRERNRAANRVARCSRRVNRLRAR